MKILVVALLLLSCASLIGAESKVEGLSISDFDTGGHRVHRLLAVSATGTIDEPKLSDGRLEFFDVQDSSAAPVGVLTFAEANFHRTSGIIGGDGPICYQDAHGTIRGKGFKYTMADRHLVLRADVVLDAPSSHVVAKEGDVFMTKEPKSSKFGVTIARLLGEVVVIGSAVTKTHFDRAETESAIYTADDEMLTLASPVTTWNGDKKAVAEAERIRYYVGKKPKQSLMPTILSPTPTADAPVVPVTGAVGL